MEGWGTDDTPYRVADLRAQVLDTNKAEGEHVRSFQLALSRLARKPGRVRFDIHRPGPLIDHPGKLSNYQAVDVAGLQEVGRLLDPMTETNNQSVPRWVDFHCHVDLYKDLSALIAECDRERVATLAVTTTPKAWPRNRELASRSAHVRIALGLHPQLVTERENELSIFERYLSDARYIGEIGLDASPRFYRSFSAQERVFERILRACAEQGGKILTVHSVRAVGKVLNHIESALPQDRGRIVLHWFTGTPAEARWAVAFGCYFSINREMLRSPKHRQLVGVFRSTAC